MKNFAKQLILSSAVLALGSLGCGGGGGDGGGSGPLTLRAEPFVTGFPSFPADIVSESENRMFVAELAGAVRLIQDRVLAQQPVLSVSIAPGGGLFGLALCPDFHDNGLLYVYYTSATTGLNQIDVFHEKDGTAEFVRTLLDGIPAGGHDGGKMLFLPDGTLFVSTGDAGNPALAQDNQSLAGKVLRINEDGSIPSDNPNPLSPVYASGFRNLFGMTYDRGDKRLVVADNGPDCDDEVDIVVPGGNYGWRPDQPCGEENPAFVSPALRLPTTIGITGITTIRGGDLGDWSGDQLFGDFNLGKIWHVRLEGAVSTLFESALEMNEPVLALHTTTKGTVYFSTGNALYRLAPAS